MSDLHLVLDWVLWLLLISSWVFEIVVRRQRKQRDDLIAKNKGLRAQVDANSAGVLKCCVEIVVLIWAGLDKSPEREAFAVSRAIERLEKVRNLLKELREELEKVRAGAD
jgi:hypothetical protein